MTIQIIPVFLIVSGIGDKIMYEVRELQANGIFNEISRVFTMANILRLIHPVYGIVKQRVTLAHCDTVEVLKIIDQWKHLYGPKFLQCTTEWDKPVNKIYISNDLIPR